MGAYREQLLRETYGSKSPQIYGQKEEEPSGKGNPIEDGYVHV